MNLYFENHHIDTYGSQPNCEHKYILYAAMSDDIEKRVIGYVDYTVWQNKVFIDYIEVKESMRRRGVGTQLYRKLLELNKEYSYERAGFYTPEGAALRDWFEKEYLS
ncbi:GNAT family N-acetyltransferase [Bacillus swezeyi]|uniref:N-acetyltransferase n=1 Tax=Bacillus swezeyi TaxID=1925020 RepID=A0A5M8REA8_9BACI|nr:GNAT family N-acetyltransferase [Bacillus swezeyi]KAA6446937.1 N-acetyltransferase [Bacillus swezeyi]KAA6471505.1 N-acetyltransferase [Bacillus swezeyi]